MFVRAIEGALQYTRPLHTITRTWGSTTVQPGAGSLFFVNADGWALTCKHVAEIVRVADQINARYASFKNESRAIPLGGKGRTARRNIERKYGYRSDETIQLKNVFLNCVEGQLALEARIHPTLDITLLKFNDFEKLLCDAFPVFASDGTQLKQGKTLCRLGYPFPEFTNYEYDAATDEIKWTNAGRVDTPIFPIEGMVTRHLAGPSGAIVGFELSTPGLRGESGGPVFDRDGVVWGMQFATNHLDLDFDIDVDVMRNGRKRRVEDHAFLHVGHCLHVDVLKEFMRANGVSFQESAAVAKRATDVKVAVSYSQATANASDDRMLTKNV